MIRTLLAGVTLAVLALVVSGFLFAAVSSWRDQRQHPPPGQLVDVDGHRMHLLCAGEGGPTIVLESGAGGTVLDWGLVFSRLAETATVCAYDRAGLGWSERGPAPRTLGVLANETRALLAAAELEPPYLLVGHSFGGLVALQLATSSPEEIAGVVLVDAAHPDLNTRLPEGYAEASAGQLRMLSIGGLLAPTGWPRLLFPPLAPRGLPPEYEAPAKALGYRASAYRTVLEEAESFAVGAEQLDLTRLATDLPLVVLSRGRPEMWPPGISPEAAERAWAELQRELAGLSGSSTHVVVPDAGHALQIEAPDLVSSAILDLHSDLHSALSRR